MMRRISLPVSALFLTLAAGCAEAPATLAPDAEALFAKATATPGSSAADWLKALKGVTARFNSTTQAHHAGYLPDTFCVAHPVTGHGMGHHWANPELIDPVFEPLEPEVVLYAPDKNGKLRLVALEYVVIDVGQPKPSFADQPFDDGGVPPLTEAGVAHWSLHVWLYENNPEGVFIPFNPSVTCPA